MNVQQWSVVVGAVVSGLLALGPWMFMVHAKLAVIAARLMQLSENVERAAEANRELWTLYARHEARLETHDVQFAHVVERLRELTQ